MRPERSAFIKEHRDNPLIDSEIQGDFWLGFGVILTGQVNDNLVNPGLQQVLGSALPGLIGSDAGTKIFDALTTWGSAEAEMYALDLIGFRGVAGPIRKGGRALAVAKGFSILFPGYSLNGKFGSLPINLPTPFSTATPQPQLPSGATAPAGTALAGGQAAAPGASGMATPPPRPAVAGTTAGSRPMGI